MATTTKRGGSRAGIGKADARAESEGLLRDAALRVLNREGVLAGLRLQDVADEAGISRGLINYYFSSRGQLLREALDHKRASFMDSATRHRRDPILRRARRFFRTAIGDTDYAKVMALLALDDDPAFEPMFWYEEQVADIRADIEDGLVVDHDVEATLALLHAMVLGWATFRHSLARQTGVAVNKLDSRVEKVLLDLYAHAVLED